MMNTVTTIKTFNTTHTKPTFINVVNVPVFTPKFNKKRKDFK